MENIVKNGEFFESSLKRGNGKSVENLNFLSKSFKNIYNTNKGGGDFTLNPYNMELPLDSDKGHKELSKYI